jgi:carbonic anhydrase
MKTLLPSSFFGLLLLPFILPFAAASAAMQSPIDITPYNTLYTPSLQPLLFQYSTSTSISLLNTGSPDHEATIRATVEPGAGELVLGGTTYHLKQFHFHTEAEHRIDGHQAAMELHLVHLSSQGDILVVGQMIEIGAFNPLLDAIFNDLPTQPGDSRTVSNFSLDGLLPLSQTTFRYDGSLTTAPYLEGVQWNVFTEGTTMSQTQVDAFRSLFPHGDTREVQDLDGRWVLTDLKGFSAVPEPASLAVGILTIIPMICRARRKERWNSCA